MVRVAVDGMGGDKAPHAIVKGAEIAAEEGIAEIILVGDERVISPLLKRQDLVKIVSAETYVRMDEPPSSALRKKKNSSINVAMELLKEKKVDALVSAGNSGATLAFAIFTLGRISNVDRPAIATLHPNLKNGITVLLDAGGTVDCKPVHLAQFALMGDAFAKAVLNVTSPKIGLLSNGEEITKGNELTKEAHSLIEKLNLNYVGYVEGNDLYNGKVDVVVSDGFVGNIALKISEGVVEALLGFMKERIEKSLKAKIGYILLKEVFRDLSKKVDYAEYGGAPLLGVEGTCIICHGKSDERAIRNAILLAKKFAESSLHEVLKRNMERVIH
ncbi:MAG: phosphate acyltransferase PlsX [Desulfobacterota bacterium]|nr:phosphate acyltransferase PlsX [Thermodesulfobacteriota bacterium]MDW8002486.1 phosphate acyltransferase PlsX [Deltaproteobacteria bacterium]